MPKTAKVLLVIISSTLIIAFFFPPMAVFSLLAVIVLLAFLIVRRMTMSKEKLEEVRAENDAVMERVKEKAEPNRLAYEKKKAELKKRKAADKRPVSVVLISMTTHRSALSTVTRAMLGGAIFGFGGAVGGAASGKSNATHATFSVKYASGRTATETVPVTSKRFNELSALLHK